MKQEPTRFAVPRAIISRLALNSMPGIELPPKLLAATDDSKNPRRAMRKDVDMAERMCFMWAT
jgi:hypothetical protein